jgi:hypothetical protein
MKRQTLKFDELDQNFDILCHEDSVSIKGGILQPEADATWEWGIDPQGGMYYRQVGSDTWIFFETLNDVNIHPSRPTPPPSGYFGPGGFTYVPTGSDPNYGGNGSTGGTGGTGTSGNGTGAGSTPGVINGRFSLDPSITDADLMENLGLVWGVAGGVWSAQGGYTVKSNLDGTTTILVGLSVTPPQSSDHPYVVGTLKLYQNGQLIGSSSIEDRSDPNANYFREPGVLPGDATVYLPSGLTGDIQIEISIGSYNDTGAGQTGNSKNYITTVRIPPTPTP